MPDYLVSELTGVIDTAVNSRITINHGLYTTPDIVTAYVVDSALDEHVYFFLVTKNETQVEWLVMGPRKVINFRATCQKNHSVVDTRVGATYSVSGDAAGRASGGSGGGGGTEIFHDFGTRAVEVNG